jgi:hypothetical protein
LEAAGFDGERLAALAEDLEAGGLLLSDIGAMGDEELLRQAGVKLGPAQRIAAFVRGLAQT